MPFARELFIRSRHKHFVGDITMHYDTWAFGQTRVVGRQPQKGYVFIQRSIQSVGPLKALYTTLLGRPVHSATN